MIYLISLIHSESIIGTPHVRIVGRKNGRHMIQIKISKQGSHSHIENKMVIAQTYE